jgi:hypothetical protein
MKLFIITAFLINNILSVHYLLNARRPPPPSPLPPYKIPPPASPAPFQPPFPPGVPLNACKTFIPNLCDRLYEPNYFDVNCYSNEDPYGGLGCNAGGLICCRFCEFSHYKSVPCILSPSLPPRPPPPPSSPPSPPPKNPLIMPIGDPIIEPDKSKVNFHMRIDSDIESVDKNKIELNIFKMFNRYVSRQFIKINFRPGSLIVDVSILTNTSIVENTSHIIETFTPIELSNSLNITVVELTPPLIVNYHEEIEDFNKEDDLIKYYGLGILLMILFVCIGYVCYRTDYKYNNKDDLDLTVKNTKEKNSKTIEINFDLNRLSGIEKCNETKLFQNSYRDNNLDRTSTTNINRSFDC